MRARWALLVFLVPVAGGNESLRSEIQRDYAEHLQALFLHFHRNPELSFVETRTAARLAEELRAAGATVTENVGGTGVVGLLENGEGPTVLVRADMDGLPVQEKSGLPYASTATQVDVTGKEMPVMHACGHDVHMTALVGTARRLAALRDLWQGTVVLIGQPAEERVGGAKAMLADGLYERFPRPDCLLALHVSAEQPAGKVALRPGTTYSGSDSVEITVHGIGAHGASPHKGKDPIYVASQIVVALQSLVSRELSPLEPGVVTVGAIHGGTKHNIIPDSVELLLTVRSNTEETRAKLLAGIERIAKGVACAAGLPEDRLPDVRLAVESTPITVNDPALTARLRQAFERELGADRVLEYVPQGMGAEDFAYFARVAPPIPSVYFQVGGTPEAELEAEARGGPAVPSHHSPFFKVVPDDSIQTGIEAMTAAVLELLERS